MGRLSWIAVVVALGCLPLAVGTGVAGAQTSTSLPVSVDQSDMQTANVPADYGVLTQSVPAYPVPQLTGQWSWHFALVNGPAGDSGGTLTNPAITVHSGLDSSQFPGLSGPTTACPDVTRQGTTFPITWTQAELAGSGPWTCTSSGPYQLSTAQDLNRATVTDSFSPGFDSFRTVNATTIAPGGTQHVTVGAMTRDPIFDVPYANLTMYLNGGGPNETIVLGSSALPSCPDPYVDSGNVPCLEVGSFGSPPNVTTWWRVQHAVLNTAYNFDATVTNNGTQPAGLPGLSINAQSYTPQDPQIPPVHATSVTLPDDSLSGPTGSGSITFSTDQVADWSTYVHRDFSVSYMGGQPPPPPPTGVTGTVTLSGSFPPGTIAGAGACPSDTTFSLNCSNAAGNHFSYATTDASGHYSLSLNPGTWNVEGFAVPGGNVAAITLTDAVPVTVVAGQTIPGVNFTVVAVPDPKGHVTGTVTGSGGTVLPNAGAAACPAGQPMSANCQGLVTTPADPNHGGSYTLNLQPGSYNVTGYAFINGTLYGATEQAPVTVSPGQTVTGQNFVVNVSNTATLPAAVGGGTVTVAAPSGTTLSGVSATDPITLPSPPPGVTLPSGLLSFTVNGVAPGGSADVMIQFPAGVMAPNGYAKYENGAWSDASNLVTAISSTSVTIHLVDGGAGDADGQANGTIVDPGGPAVFDHTPPVVSVGGVQDGSTYTLGAVPAATCSASDAGAGLSAPCTTATTGGNANGVGAFTTTTTATDRAGNTATSSATYTVIYRFDGYLQPINDTAHQTGLATSVFKAGSTVPVKLQLKRADGTLIQAVTEPVWITPVKGSSMSSSVDESVYTAPTDSGQSLRLNGDHYAYNWGTDKSQGGYYWRIAVRLDDGTTRTVNVGLR